MFAIFLSVDKSQEEVAKVWTLSASDMLDDEVELVDDDALLDEDDLKKPDPSSLKGRVSLFVCWADIVHDDILNLN